MGSVYVTWRGQCTDRERQEHLLSYLKRWAARNVVRLPAPAEDINALSKMLHASRAEGLPEIPDFTLFDQVVEGNILVNADLFEDKKQAFEQAVQLGLEVERSKEGNFIRLHRATLYGIQFRLYDPRGLYPGEDRMGFVFLRSDEVPFLEGALVLVDDHACCQMYSLEAIKQADWHVSLPYVHLRYYLEDWCDFFFTWLKHFWMPELTWNGYEPNRNFEVLIAALRPLLEAKPDGAMDLIFEKLLSDFEEEADKWERDMAGKRDLHGYRSFSLSNTTHSSSVSGKPS